MPERHKDCGSKMLKVFVSKNCSLLQYTVFKANRSALGAPQIQPRTGGWLPSTGRACFLASSEQCKQLGERFTELTKQTNFPNKL